MKYFFFLAILSTTLIACTPASTADVDLDGETDIFVNGNKAKDANSQDNILIVDGFVVNAITNQHWTPKDGNLAIVNEPTFTMEYNPDTKTWRKLPLKD